MAALGLRCFVQASSSCGEQGLFSLQCTAFSLLWLLVAEHRLWVPGLRQLQRSGLVVVTLRLSCSTACRILLDPRSNACPLQWQVGSHPLYHQGSPCKVVVFLIFWRIFILFSVMAVPVSIPNNITKFPFCTYPCHHLFSIFCLFFHNIHAVLICLRVNCSPDQCFLVFLPQDINRKGYFLGTLERRGSQKNGEPLIAQDRRLIQRPGNQYLGKSVIYI